MVRLSQKRVVVNYLGAAYPISQRRACQTVRCARASYRYRSHRTPPHLAPAAHPGAGSSHSTMPKSASRPGGRNITRTYLKIVDMVNTRTYNSVHAAIARRPMGTHSGTLP